MHAVSAVLAVMLSSQGVHATATSTPASAAATDPESSGKMRVAILGLRNDGVDPTLVPQVVDALALRISRHSETEVLTSTDIEAVLGLEATRQALDCDQGSCAAMDEITRALDVRYTIGGSIAPRGEGFYVHASLVDVTGGRAVARSGAHVKGDDYAVELGPLAEELLRGLHGEGATSGRRVAGVVPTTERGESDAAQLGLPLISWIGVGVTGVAAVVGGVGGILWAIDDHTIRDKVSPFATKKDARDRYLVDQAVLASGAVVAAFGVAMIVAGFTMAE